MHPQAGGVYFTLSYNTLCTGDSQQLRGSAVPPDSSRVCVFGNEAGQYGSLFAPWNNKEKVVATLYIIIHF